jgi:flagellar export protein FliJ
MAKLPPYRLQTLLEMRQRAEEDAKNAFAKAMAALHEEQRIQKEMEDELVRMVEDRKRRRREYADKLASGEMKITDQASAYRFIDRMKELEQEQQGRIDGQRENVREAEKLVKRAQDVLIQATQDLKALEKHREKWAEEVKKEMALKEENLLDEIGQTIFSQQSSRK